jgi:hypothetical protein
LELLDHAKDVTSLVDLVDLVDDAAVRHKFVDTAEMLK